MNNHHFTFPPPPPPPPQASTDPNRYPQYSSVQRGPHDRGRGRGRGHGGRGRGHERGGQRGGHVSSYGGYPPKEHRQSDNQFGQPNIYGSNYPLPNYPIAQQSQYPASAQTPYGYPPHQAPPAPYPNSPQPSYSGYTANGLQPAPNFGGQHSNQHYEQGSPPPRPHNPRHASSQGLANQPIVMPPIRVGRDGRGGILRTQAAPPNPFSQRPQVYNSYQEHLPHSFQMAQYDAPNPYPNSRGRGHKRGHSDAFNKPRHTKPTGQVAPAVPSFGNPLPGESLNRPQVQAISTDATRKPKKKKRRRHNQLGLTPKTEEHESSSEEEDDQDEEMKLAAAVGAATQQIRFEYNGQTSTLQSSSEIAAWIAERKKRFPTKARAAEAAERKRQNEETRRLARQAAKESQEKRRAEAREEQEQRKAELKEKKDKLRDAAKPRDVKLEETEIAQGIPDNKDAAALKARLRVEKLRRRLEKEEKRVAKAEAKASRSNLGGPMPTDLSELAQSPNSRKRKRTDSLGSSDSRNRKLGNSIFETKATESTQHVDPLTLETNVDVSVSEESKTAIDTTNSPLSTSKQAPDTAQNPLTPTSQPSVPDIDHSAPPLRLSDDQPAAPAPDAALPRIIPIEGANKSDNDSDLPLSESSSDISSDSDFDDDPTSSSGSSSSSDSDAAPPESHSIKEHNPPRVPAPKRKSKAKPSNRDICRQFLKNGRCPRGEKCHYRHELPEKGSMSKMERKAEREARVAGGKKERRKGLYQRLVEQEKEQEEKDRRALQAAQLNDRSLLSADGHLTGPPPRNGKWSAENGYLPQAFLSNWSIIYHEKRIAGRER